MKAILCDNPGANSTLRLGEAPDPNKKPTEILIRVQASGVNRADLSQRRGTYPPPPGASEILGLEVSGEVLEGDAAKMFKPGERVMALLAGGGYAAKVAVDAGSVMRIPEGYSFVEAAGVVEAFLTAHHNVFTLGEAHSGVTVLIHAGASGVGSSAIQMLRASGIRVLCTVGNAEKAEFCRKLGAEPIVYRDTDFSEAVNAATDGRGVGTILDCVGAGYLKKNLSCLSPEGRIVYIGLLGGVEEALDFRILLNKRARLIGSTLRALPVATKARIVDRFRDAFYEKLARREIAPWIDAKFPAHEVMAAHERMQKNLNAGKIVLEWNGLA